MKKLRAEHNWNRSDLANKAGFDPSFISRIEKGDRNITLEVLDKIAGAFGVETYELLQGAKVDEFTLREKIARVEELDPLKKMMVEQMIDAFLKEKLKGVIYTQDTGIPLIDIYLWPWQKWKEQKVLV